MSALSTIERIGSNKIGQSEVDWVIRPVGQPAGPPNLKKPTTLRGAVGVWHCESSDYIGGRDGACLHAVRFLVRSERLEHNQCHGLFLSFLRCSSLNGLSLFCVVTEAIPGAGILQCPYNPPVLDPECVRTRVGGQSALMAGATE